MLAFCGERKVAKKFMDRFWKFCRNTTASVSAGFRTPTKKKGERQYGLLLQASTAKNGVGGLRDYQGVLWMVPGQLEVSGLEGLQKEMPHRTRGKDFGRGLLLSLE